jgi:hypothetical protein
MLSQCIELMNREEFRKTVKAMVDVCMSSLSPYFVYLYIVLLCHFSILFLLLYYTMKKNVPVSYAS